MRTPEGKLTCTQYQIMESVWEQGNAGATVAEIWRAVFSRRSVGRTTILNLVDRLEKRGWLIRRENEKPCRYSAALDRGQTAALLAGGFVDDFFGGSASELVMSLLGSRRLNPDDIERLRCLLESARNKGNARTGSSRDDA
jgi:predicted transcriptional regulator